MKRSTGRCTSNLFSLLSRACKYIIAYHSIINLLAPSKVRWVDLLPPRVPALVPSNITHYSIYYYSASTLRSPRAATYRYSPDQTLYQSVRQPRKTRSQTNLNQSLSNNTRKSNNVGKQGPDLRHQLQCRRAVVHWGIRPARTQTH